MSNPRILIYDIETGGVNALRSSLGMMLCFGYKWLDEKQVHCLTVDQYKGWFDPKRPQPIDDKPILWDALKIMESADLLVAHYGDRFDRRFVQGRCAINDLPPPPPTKQRDTWRIMRGAFNFSSNRLGDAAMFLGLKEQKHQKSRDEWPGWWLQAMAGHAPAIHAMANYCKQDVLTLEQLYLRVRPYDNLNHPHVWLDRAACGMCGKKTIQYRGFAYVGINKYRRFVCTSCGRWGRERKATEGL